MKSTLIVVAGVFSLAGCAGSLELPPDWEYTGGPYGQDVTALLPDAQLPDHLYAGLRTGEVFRSTSGGNHWERLSLIEKNAAIFRLIQDPEVPVRFYAATTAGAFVSTDQGATWSNMGLAGSSSRLAVLSLTIDQWKPAVIYAGTEGHGLFRSTDAGLTWAPILASDYPALSSSDVYDVAVDLLKPDLVYAAVSGIGILRSLDAGATWQRLTPEYGPAGLIPTNILVNHAASQQLLYGTNAGDIFRSTNGGQTWASVRNGAEGERILALIAHPTDPATVFAGTGGGVLRSTDFGTKWEPLSGDLPRVPTSVVLPPGKIGVPIYVFGAGVGLQTSTNMGTSWSSIDKGLGGATATIVLTDKNGRQLYAAVGRTLLRFDDSSATWISAGSGLTGGPVEGLTFDAELTSTLYAATQNGVFRSDAAGTDWQSGPRRLSIIPRFLEAHPAIPTRLYASGEQGLFVSTDRGNSWGQAKPIGNKFSVRALTFMETNAGIIYATGPSGFLSATDGGFTWTVCRIPSGADAIAAVTLDATNPAVCYAWIPSGDSYRSNNRGLEWTRLQAPWVKGQRVHIAVDRFSPSSAIAVLDGKEIYYTSTGGAWTKAGETASALDIAAIHWNSRTGMIVVGTRDRGVFRLRLGEPDSEIVEE